MSLRVELALREKRDRDGEAYLFAPIQALNMVCFVYTEPPRAGVKRAKLVLTPYRGSNFKAAWEEEEDASPSQVSLPFSR